MVSNKTFCLSRRNRSEPFYTVVEKHLFMERNFDENYIEYLPILQRHGLLPKISWPWLQVGKVHEACGLALHLSVATKQGLELLEWVIPILIRAKVRFRVIKNQSLHYKLNCGYFGNMEQAKAISIYPSNRRQTSWLIWKLRKGTSFYKGPTIPTATRLANILHGDVELAKYIWIINDKRKSNVIYSRGRHTSESITQGIYE